MTGDLERFLRAEAKKHPPQFEVDFTGFDWLAAAPEWWRQAMSTKNL